MECVRHFHQHRVADNYFGCNNRALELTRLTVSSACSLKSSFGNRSFWVMHVHALNTIAACVCVYVILDRFNFKVYFQFRRSAEVYDFICACM